MARGNSKVKKKQIMYHVFDDRKIFYSRTCICGEKVTGYNQEQIEKEWQRHQCKK